MGYKGKDTKARVFNGKVNIIFFKHSMANG